MLPNHKLMQQIRLPAEARFAGRATVSAIVLMAIFAPIM
ncbi:hypothetical protein CFU_4400 [Collimonas fungivorans Ter331]|uniref:Uncharacterized protein n=1 Tax=Collimonas fungivorans (strain Ter331) TaxID=1005048 RepID=G0AEL3_COLFT|nr:hypothetical protein CFU_4400 [Collimonas fungivorans Ter331]